MKKLFIILLLIFATSSNSYTQKVEIDNSKHDGLEQLQTSHSLKVLHSEGLKTEAQAQANLIEKAYVYLSALMGEKEDFCLLVLSEEDWKTNAYLPIPGMPEYYKGNLIVGGGYNALAQEYEAMLQSFPEEQTKDLIQTYTNESGDFDMKLYFDKLSIHELTHNFQDPNNGEGFSISRWLEELHANMGMYAYYKFQEPQSLKYITTITEFLVAAPPPNLQYTTLEDFDKHYYDLAPETYGFYQMKFTKSAQQIIDQLGAEILKPLNNFLIKYDESQAGSITPAEFKARLSKEVDSLFASLIDDWK